jgi:hypothetical protein
VAGHEGVELFNPVALGTSRYRYRGAKISPDDQDPA